MPIWSSNLRMPSSAFLNLHLAFSSLPFEHPSQLIFISVTLFLWRDFALFLLLIGFVVEATFQDNFLFFYRNQLQSNLLDLSLLDNALSIFEGGVRRHHAGKMILESYGFACYWIWI